MASSNLVMLGTPAVLQLMFLLTGLIGWTCAMGGCGLFELTQNRDMISKLLKSPFRSEEASLDIR